jgi:SulP family sulfate permease
VSSFYGSVAGQDRPKKPLVAATLQRLSADSALGGERECVDSCETKEEGKPIHIGIIYGMINATIVLPVLMSFGSIIYRDEAFQPYRNVLIKLTVISGVVHQLCFSTLSSLPFAVGQVQDAGFIFLSSMAGILVQECRSHGVDDETMLATVTIGLSLSTALLGIALV